MEGARLNEAWDRAFRGELGEVDGNGAWRACLAAHRALMGAGRAPTCASLAALDGSQEARAIGALSACLLARLGMLAFDRAAFDEALACAARLEAGSGAPRAAQWVEVTRCWAEFFDGRLGALPPRLEALAAAASRERFAELVIEANVLRAAVALELDDLSSATALTRRVSRMARAEGMLHEEVLAHVFLARARRRSERAHLASRIVAALFAAAPTPWRAWLGWEQRLSGEPLSERARIPEGALLAESPSSPGGEAERLIDACLAGDAMAPDGLLRSTRGFAPHTREARALVCALDPRSSASEPGVAEWASGARLRLPLGLDAIVTSTANRHVELAGNAWVIATPTACRRFLHPGIGLVSDLPIFEQTARKHGRTELATAVLALAGEGGLSITRFVREVYGFAYAKETHDGMLRVLVHRMRAGLRDVATVDVEDERIRLGVVSPFLVPDPRTAPSSAEPVLRMIAVRPGASAKEIAAALAIPLRTVQAVLNQLVLDGSCLVDREAGGVAYRIEDTTFSDPTRTRTLDPA